MDVQLSIEILLPLADARTLLLDPWAAGRWSHGRIDLSEGGSCRLVDRADIEWLGHVVSLDDDGLVLRLAEPPSHPGLGTADFHLEVVAHSATRSTVNVRADRADDPRLAAVWQPVLRRFRSMVAEVRGRRLPEQAVVVVHGIGEQRPGETLHAFVSTVAGLAPDDEPIGEVWSSHDDVSGSYELRKLTLTATETRPRTTFYEYYWANQVHDTTLGDVVGWVWTIMRRSPRRIPGHLRVVWLLLWGLLLAAVVAVVSFTQAPEETGGITDLADGVQWVSTALTLLLAVVTGFVVRYLGDAARYLSARPRNVAIRQAIREGGVDLVRQLHDSGRYQRIVLVGHSLGSVVAYDIVRHLWPELHREHLRPEQASFTAITDAHAEPPPDGRSRRSVQAAAWREARRNTQPWLVTDLVTLGSPLAHAHLLMSEDATDFAARRDRGEFPVSPPIRSNRGDRFSFNRPYRTRSGIEGRSFTVLDAAAPFAATRWTNLFFPAPLGLFGDLVGGRVAPVFDDGVVDVPLRSRLPLWRRRSVFSHTWYWRQAARSGNDHVEVLLRALELDMAPQLRTESQKHDPLLYCRTTR